MTRDQALFLLIDYFNAVIGGNAEEMKTAGDKIVDAIMAAETETQPS